jgi:hypothetical protein
MRTLTAILGTLALAGCATTPQQDNRFQVGAEPEGLVMIGVAENAAHTQPEYFMLWRKVDPVTGEFAAINGHTAFEAHTNDNNSTRVRGIPGEFEAKQLEPGVYALDSVFAILHDERVNYFAQGLVTGPQRPSFQLEAGQAVYLGIWELTIHEEYADGHLWRLDGADMNAAETAANAVNGEIIVTPTELRSVPCDAPHRLSNLSQRQVC